MQRWVPLRVFKRRGIHVSEKDREAIRCAAAAAMTNSRVRATHANGGLTTDGKRGPDEGRESAD